MRVLILTLLGCLLAGCDSSGSAAADRGKAGASQGGVVLSKLDRSHAGTVAPDVSFLSHDGTAAKVADFKGKPVLVNLWATWCAPCIAELPELDVMARGEAKRLVVLTISQDLGGWRAVDKFWTPGKFKTIVPRLDKQGDFATAMSAQGLPVSVLYDAKGREVWRVNGPLKWTSGAVLTALR